LSRRQDELQSPLRALASLFDLGAKST